MVSTHNKLKAVSVIPRASQSIQEVIEKMQQYLT